MNFLKSIWRKLFGVRTGVYSSGLISYGYERERNDMKLHARPAYDPFQDPDKIMKGEVESYFD